MSVYALHVACGNVDEGQYPPRAGGWQLPGGGVGQYNGARLIYDLVYTVHPDALQNDILGDGTNDFPTVARVKKEISKIAEKAKNAGDIVIFSFHGHGAAFDTPFDTNVWPGGDGKANAQGGMLLWDAMLIGDDYKFCVNAFNEGVRFVSIIDACSASGVGAAFGAGATSGNPALSTASAVSGNDIYNWKKGQYDPYLAFRRPNPTLIHFGACGMEETTYCDEYGGYFAQSLVGMYNEYGPKVSSYPDEPKLSYYGLRNYVASDLACKVATAVKEPCLISPRLYVHHSKDQTPLLDPFLT